MDLAVGAIVEGKVTGITKFGAFVCAARRQVGYGAHFEVASTFVNDIKDFLQEGQQVKVKIINIDQAGRINLRSKAQPQEPRQPRQERRRAALRRVSRVSSVRPHRADVCSRHRRTRPR